MSASSKQDIVRVLRVLEYIGSRSWVESTLENNRVKRVWRTNSGVG